MKHGSDFIVFSRAGFMALEKWRITAELLT